MANIHFLLHKLASVQASGKKFLLVVFLCIWPSCENVLLHTCSVVFWVFVSCFNDTVKLLQTLHRLAGGVGGSLCTIDFRGYTSYWFTRVTFTITLFILIFFIGTSHFKKT